MNINATLLGEALMFAIFIWFCMKFIWPPIIDALEKRRKIVADGLEAARMGEVALRDASLNAANEIAAAKEKAAEIIAAAERAALNLSDERRKEAKNEADSILEGARIEIELERSRMCEELRARFTELAVAGAEKIIRREINADVHAELLSSVVGEL